MSTTSTAGTFSADATSNRAGTKWTVRLRDADGAIVHEVGASSRPKYLVLKVQDGEPRVHSATPSTTKPRTRTALAVPVLDRNDARSTTKPDSSAARKPRRTPKPKAEAVEPAATPETAAAPTEATNEQDPASVDPREAAYMFVFDSFAAEASEVAETTDTPTMTTAQARKLLKSLAPIVVSTRVHQDGRDATVWQCAETYDHATREQAEQTIREFINEKESIMPATTKKSPKPAAKKSPAKKSAGVAASQYTEAQFKLGVAAREAGGSWVAVAEAAGVKSDHHFSVALRAFHGSDPKPAKAATPKAKPVAKAAKPAPKAKTAAKKPAASTAKKPARRIVRKAAK